MTLTQAQAREVLWRDGDLSYLLHETQELMRERIAASPAEVCVMNCARRLGKTFLACVLAIEQCLQQPGSQVRYAAPTGKAVRKMVTPNMRKILADCPQELRPAFNQMDGTWVFPNGSEIHVAGVNNGHADDLRGVESHLCIVDEAGFVGRGSGRESEASDDDSTDELEYLVESVLMPQLLTTNGRIVLLSTPPLSPAHSFVSYCTKAEAANDGSYSRFTLHDARHIPKERVERFIAKAGGPTASKVRREYFAEFVVDESRAVLPEFSRFESVIMVERERPKYFVPFIVGDAGFHDHTFVGFGYYDFRAGVDYIEAEYVVNRTLARDIDTECSRIAVELWGLAQAQAANRHVDAPAQSVAELNANITRDAAEQAEKLGKPLPIVHNGWRGIAKVQTDGRFLVAATNDLRTRLETSVRIHPRCTRLRAHARNAIWRKPGVDYERMAGYGHFDGVAMLTYAVRLIDRVTNPYPALPEGVSHLTHWIEPSEEQDVATALASRWRAPKTAGARR